MKILVEACVETLEESLAAARGGADRLELCDNMAVGGTTPSAALIAEVKRSVSIPVSVMIRPRGGRFVFNRVEIDAMQRDIDMALEAGADMLVIGVLDPSRRVEVNVTRELVARAKGTPVTFHKAFDEIPDQRRALEALIDVGVSRLLTSGGAPTALEGTDALATLIEQASGRAVIMAGGTVRGHNVRQIVERGGVTEVHARCNLDPARISDIVAALA